MRRLAITVAAVLAALAAAPAARADYVIEGRGFGHGVGMSQYGAYGFALREGRDFRWILAHYYTGTSVGTVASSRIRVLLRRTRAPKLCGVSALRAAGGRRLRLRESRVYRVSPAGADRLQVVDTSNGRTRGRVTAPVRVTGDGLVCVRGAADNGVTHGSYRGAVTLSRDGGGVLVVNDVSLELYLYGVVPAEMPASWSAEALKAQAVVARSYALRSRRAGEPFDVYADVRSQVYRGLAAELPSSTAAVRATRALAVRYGVEIAQTFFHSTSGGRTAANEEGFGGGLPVPYLRAVDDPYDDISPVHTWTVTLTDRQAGRKLREVLEGDLEGLEVSATTPTGRVATVDVGGSDGTVPASGATIRRLLGLRSTWFTIRHEDA